MKKKVNRDESRTCSQSSQTKKINLQKWHPIQSQNSFTKIQIYINEIFRSSIMLILPYIYQIRQTQTITIAYIRIYTFL